MLNRIFCLFAVVAISAGAALGQMQQSGGAGGGNVTITQGGNTALVSAAGAVHTNLAQVGGTAITLGQKAMTASVPVVIASDQATFTLSATQSGTWTMQPGNTANTTAWLVKNVPVTTCGVTAFDSGLIENIATGAGTDLTATATCVQTIYFTNKTASPVTVTLRDKSGTPKDYMTTFTLPANSNLLLPLNGMKFTGGITVISGTATALHSQVFGFQ